VTAFDQYLEALEAYQKGEHAKAADLMAKALGGKGATPPISRSLQKIFDRSQQLHGSVTDVLFAEERKRRSAK
jgi:hypothetical protein